MGGRHCLLLAADDFPDTRRAERPEFARLELDEVAARNARPTAPTLELAITDGHLTFEPDENTPTAGPNPCAITIDYAPFVGCIEDFTRKRGVCGDCFEPVDGRRKIDFLGFEMGQEVDAEVDF